MFKLDRIINSVYYSITWFVIDDSTHNAIMIDCGDAEPIINYLYDNGLSLEGIFITHSHYDHIYGLNEVVDAFPECKVYTSANGKISLPNSKYNLSRYETEINVSHFEYDRENIVVLDEGDTILFANTQIEVLNTEGHDWSCLSYIISDWFFTGDSYVPSSKLVFTFPKSNRTLAKEQEQRIINISQQRKLHICAGHIFIKK